MKRLTAIFAAALVVRRRARRRRARPRAARPRWSAWPPRAARSRSPTAPPARRSSPRTGSCPGQATSGTLTLGNTGEAAGLLVLARTSIHDQPGPVRRPAVGRPHAPDRGRQHRARQPREIFYGEVGGLERVALDALPGGAQRTYRFTVEFPDTGPGGADNAYMGAVRALRLPVARGGAPAAPDGDADAQPRQRKPAARRQRRPRRSRPGPPGRDAERALAARRSST